MTDKSSKKRDRKELQAEMEKPWISMRTGMWVVAGASLLMAVLTALSIDPARGWLERILWGLLFGAMIWVIFFGNIWLNRFLRRKK